MPHVLKYSIKLPNALSHANVPPFGGGDGPTGFSWGMDFGERGNSSVLSLMSIFHGEINERWKHKWKGLTSSWTPLYTWASLIGLFPHSVVPRMLSLHHWASRDVNPIGKIPKINPIRSYLGVITSALGNVAQKVTLSVQSNPYFCLSEIFKPTTWPSFLVNHLPIMVMLPPDLRVAYLGKSPCFLTMFSYLTAYADAVD